MDNVALDRLYRMAREWESGVEYQRDVEADKARQGERNDAHTVGGR